MAITKSEGDKLMVPICMHTKANKTVNLFILRFYDVGNLLLGVIQSVFV